MGKGGGKVRKGKAIQDDADKNPSGLNSKVVQIGSKKKRGGRVKGQQNRATKTAREIIISVVDNLAPQVQEKFDMLDPKDWLMAYMKLIEFAVPKVAPVQAPDVDADRPDVIIKA